MKLKKLQDKWNYFGKTDPLWYIATNPKTKNNNWKEKEFFHTGDYEIKKVIDRIRLLKDPIKDNRVLDFGCGVGRLTQAFSKYYKKAYGVDISSSMIKLANKFNKYSKKCKYIQINEDNLKIFQDNYFDLIYSNITLQHIEPRFVKNYLIEFLRILTPDGLLMFQLTDHPRLYCKIMKFLKYGIYTKEIYKLLLTITRMGYLEGYDERKRIDTFGINKNKVIQLIINNKGRIISINKDNNAGNSWVSYFYIVAKK